MTEAKVNYNFEEAEVDVTQIEVENDLGRAVEHLELVYLGGYFGEVRAFDGIADGARGIININPNRLIGTTQIEITDTFVLDAALFFNPGGSVAAGELEDTTASGSIEVGIVTKVNNGVAVTFRPYGQPQGLEVIV